MVRDLRAECLAGVCIGNGSVARSADHARRARSNRVTTLLQREHRDLEALTFFTNHVLLGHTYVLQRKITRIAGPYAELAVNRSRREPLHGALDDKTRHAGVIALASLLFIGPAKEKKVVGDVGQTDPHLLAIQDPLVTVTSCRRTCSHDIGTGARLSQTIGRDLFASCLGHEIFLLLLFAAPR